MANRDLQRKLNVRNDGVEIVNAIIAVLVAIALVSFGIGLEGWLAFWCWVIFGMQVFGILLRVIGYRSVVLSPSDQDYLAVHPYKG